MAEEQDHVDLALIKQNLQRDEERIANLERRVSEIDRTVLTGKIGVIVLIGLGSFIGWIISVSDKLRSWFH